MWDGDIPIKIIRDGTDRDIIQQYVRFSKISTEELRRTPKDLRGAVERTIKICQEEGILLDFLADHEAEVHNTMQLFTEEFMKRAAEKTAFREGMQKGMQQGMQKGTLNTLCGLVRGGYLNADVASSQAGLSLDAFNAKLAEYDAQPRA